jgi:hypothetical protein
MTAANPTQPRGRIPGLTDGPAKAQPLGRAVGSHTTLSAAGPPRNLVRANPLTAPRGDEGGASVPSVSSELVHPVRRGALRFPNTYLRGLQPPLARARRSLLRGQPAGRTPHTVEEATRHRIVLQGRLVGGPDDPHRRTRELQPPVLEPGQGIRGCPACAMIPAQWSASLFPSQSSLEYPRVLASSQLLWLGIQTIVATGAPRTCRQRSPSSPSRRSAPSPR